MKVIVLNEHHQCVWKFEAEEANLETVLDDEDEQDFRTLDDNNRWNLLKVKDRVYNHRLNFGETYNMTYYEDNDTRGPGRDRTPLGADYVRI